MSVSAGKWPSWSLLTPPLGESMAGDQSSFPNGRTPAPSAIDAPSHGPTSGPTPPQPSSIDAHLYTMAPRRTAGYPGSKRWPTDPRRHSGPPRGGCCSVPVPPEHPTPGPAMSALRQQLGPVPSLATDRPR